MTNEAMYQLAALLPPKHRGVFSDSSQATTAQLEFVHPDGSNLPGSPKR
jgi:hypothetical protein